MKAIIVEDEFLAAMHAETALKDLGLQVVGIAEDTASAMALAARNPQIALVDLNLRDGFTGPAVATRLESAGVRVIFLTANPRELDGSNVSSPVLEKPLEEHKLAQVLNLGLPKATN